MTKVASQEHHCSLFFESAAHLEHKAIIYFSQIIVLLYIQIQKFVFDKLENVQRTQTTKIVYLKKINFCEKVQNRAILENLPMQNLTFTLLFDTIMYLHTQKVIYAKYLKTADP